MRVRPSGSCGAKPLPTCEPRRPLSDSFSTSTTLAVWGGPQPLLFQAVLNPISLLDNSLFHIHIMWHPADGAGVLGKSLILAVADAAAGRSPCCVIVGRCSTCGHVRGRRGAAECDGPAGGIFRFKPINRHQRPRLGAQRPPSGQVRVTGRSRVMINAPLSAAVHSGGATQWALPAFHCQGLALYQSGPSASA
jgi:hypothetical protein